jgi:hypothetical protein
VIAHDAVQSLDDVAGVELELVRPGTVEAVHAVLRCADLPGLIAWINRDGVPASIEQAEPSTYPLAVAKC